MTENRRGDPVIPLALAASSLTFTAARGKRKASPRGSDAARLCCAQSLGVSGHATWIGAGGGGGLHVAISGGGH